MDLKQIFGNFLLESMLHRETFPPLRQKYILCYLPFASISSLSTLKYTVNTRRSVWLIVFRIGRSELCFWRYIACAVDEWSLSGEPGTITEME
jgi:hypothetical protein